MGATLSAICPGKPVQYRSPIRVRVIRRKGTIPKSEPSEMRHVIFHHHGFSLLGSPAGLRATTASTFLNRAASRMATTPPMPTPKTTTLLYPECLA